MYKKVLKSSINPLVLSVTIAVTSGCLSSSTDEKVTVEGDLDVPRITMELPPTLSGVVSPSSGSNAKASVQLAAAADDPSGCSGLMDTEANFMENGYSMTRFLVGMSQMFSCQTDFLLAQMVPHIQTYAGQGIVSLPSNPSDPQAPTHAKLDRSGDTVHLWLYFAATDTPDPMIDPTMYVSWTGTGDNVSGQFFMINMAAPPDDPDAPKGIRVDFVRSLGYAENDIFLDMREGHSGGMDGFHTQVVKTGDGDLASYEAKGLIAFMEGTSTFPNLPATENFTTPSFSAATVLAADGSGASIASFNNFAMHLANDANNDGDYLDSQEFSLGSYQYTIQNETYFDFEGTIEWIGSDVPDAVYVNTSTNNLRVNVDMFITALEGDGLLDPVTNTYSIPGFQLGAGYFTNTCSDDNGANCTDFMAAMYANGNFMGLPPSDPLVDKPTDGREAQLDNLLLDMLTSVNPDGEDGTTTFVLPAY